MKLSSMMPRGGLKITEEATSLSEKISVRFDNGNTNTMTQGHAHVFARQNGQGKPS